MKRKLSLRQGGDAFAPVFRPPACLLILFLLCIVHLSARAQQPAATTIRPAVAISGRIINEKGESLGGATAGPGKGREEGVTAIGMVGGVLIIIGDPSRDQGRVAKAVRMMGRCFFNDERNPATETVVNVFNWQGIFLQQKIIGSDDTQQRHILFGESRETVPAFGSQGRAVSIDTSHSVGMHGSTDKFIDPAPAHAYEGRFGVETMLIRNSYQASQCRSASSMI